MRNIYKKDDTKKTKNKKLYTEKEKSELDIDKKKNHR